MALERFIPKSPDTNIRNTQDFEIAKFGHLNTVVEYINNNAVQLAGLNGYVQFNNNGALGGDAGLFWDNVNKRLGVGIVTPGAELHINGHNGFGASLKITTDKVNSVAYVQMISNYVTGFEQYQYGGPGWGWPNWTTNRSAGTAAAPLAAGSNFGLNEYGIWSYDGTGSGIGYNMMTRTSETWTPAAHGVYTVFSSVATGSVSLVERMRFSGGGNITFNNASDTAKVSIKGSGSTSATTSLLVQNSVGNNVLKVTDDMYVTIQNTNSSECFQLLGFNSDASIKFTPSGSQSNIVLKSQASSLLISTIANDFADVRAQGGAQTLRIGTNNFAGGGVNYYASLNGAVGYHKWFFNNVQYAQLTVAQYVLDDSGTLTRNDSAILQANSTTKGFLPPRMTTAQINAIVSPAVGLKVYNTSTNTTDTFDGTTFQRFGQQTLIKGSGSTSATTSLLVQNSAGTDTLQLTDNGNLSLGTTASGLGGIYVPHDASFGIRPFLFIQGSNVPILSTLSNALLLIPNSFISQGTMQLTNVNTGILGATANEINNSSIILKGAVNSYNGTSQNDATNIIFIDGQNNTLQANGSINFVKILGNVNEAGGGGTKFCTGIYYNPTFTGGTLLANSHYCYHATSGQMMINTTTPNNSAQLQVDSTTRGFLPPRMTTAQINAIVTPAEGLVAYNTTISHLCVYQSGAWAKLNHSPM